MSEAGKEDEFRSERLSIDNLQRQEGGGNVPYVDILRENVPSRENSCCKGRKFIGRRSV